MAPDPTPTPASPERVRRGLGTGRKGPVRKHLDAVVDEARRKPSWSTEHELTAVLAARCAALVDRCASEDDGKGMLQAVEKLRDLVDTLPIREGVTPGDGAAGRRAEVFELFSGGPTVGDAADA